MVFLHLQKEFCYYKVMLIMLVETRFGLTGVSDGWLSFVEMQLGSDKIEIQTESNRIGRFVWF